ncbi:NUDIX hydrolase [Virgibacillus salarius]|uniref:NUDIX hydrolase n=1 Tax=Virgibacillus salarius TaxID=447199 RepID=UPI0028527A68|nr:NUDIX domain-containing protein [Priestia megaterium]
MLETTLRREITEEVGIFVKHPIYITSASFVTDTGIHVVNIVYLCEHQSGKAIAKDPNEIAAVYWMTTEEIIHGSTIPGYVKAYIKQADRLKQKVITKTEKTFET